MKVSRVSRLKDTNVHQYNYIKKEVTMKVSRVSRLKAVWHQLGKSDGIGYNEGF